MVIYISIYEPVSGVHSGHNRDDFLVPLFPPKTNADVYKISSEFGFKYDSMLWNITSSTPIECRFPSLNEWKEYVGHVLQD